MTTFQLSTRRAKNSYDDRIGYIVSVVGGPQDLLWRATEAAALEDGAAYVERHWTPTPSGWQTKCTVTLTDGTRWVMFSYVGDLVTRTNSVDEGADQMSPADANACIARLEASDWRRVN